MKYRHIEKGFVVDVAKSQTVEAGDIILKNEATLIASQALSSHDYIIARDGEWTVISEVALNNNFENIDEEYTQRKENGCWTPYQQNCTCPACPGCTNND